MKLNVESILNNNEWKNKGYKLPLYDIERVKENTLKNQIGRAHV